MVLGFHMFLFFFFQAEDGIRDDLVTGVQTCALPIFWKVVNEDGGTGGRAHLKDWVVAGKTGTAQATDRGHEENVAWFACFAPYDHPKYVVAVMVQGDSGHGGEVAGPIATRILERTLAQDDG